MKNQNSEIQNTCLRVGIFTAIGLIAYFLIMKMFNLHYMLELRFLNSLFMFLGIRHSLNYVRRTTGSVAYMQGLGAGMYTALVATAIFVAFMGIYLTFLEPSLMEYIKENGFMGSYLSVSAIIIALFIEGTTYGIVLTFMSMQYYKRFVTKTS